MKLITSPVRKLTTGAFLTACLFTTSLSGQFNSRGDATFSSVNPLSNLEPLELLPDNVRPTSGYGIGNVTAVNGSNGHIVIVKGDLAAGVNWQQDYYSPHSIQAVKALIYNRQVYVLFNVMEPPYQYSGMFVIDPNTGAIVKTNYFARFSKKLAYYDYQSKDFTVSNGNLVVLCERTHGGIYNVRGSHILIVDPNTLSTLTSFVPYFKSNECIIPLKVVAHEDHFITLSLSKDLCDNAYYDETVLARFYYDAVNNVVTKINDMAYNTPFGVSHANIALNSNNQTLPFLLQQLGKTNEAGDLNLYVLDPVSLLPNYKNTYPTPQLHFNSNINVDSQNLTISGANNVYEKGSNGSATAIFDHTGAFVSMINNPYSVGLSGDDKQQVYKNGLVSLFVTHNIGKVNWVFGYGASRNCELTKDELCPEDRDIQTSQGVDIKEWYMNSDERYDMTNSDLRFSYKVICTPGRFGKAAQESTGLSAISETNDYQIMYNETQVTLKKQSVIGHYSLRDCYGKLIREGVSNDTNLNFRIEDYVKGIYIISFVQDGKVINERVIF